MNQKLKLLSTMRLIGTVVLVCALSVCLFAGCGPTGPDAGSTTTVPDADSTTIGSDVTTTADRNSGSSSNATGSQTVKPSGSSDKPSQGSSSTVKPTQGAAAISGISIGGTALPDFNVKTKSYTYYLEAGTTAAPQVTATKTAGTGDIKITQASGTNGAAKVTLNGVTYTIQFKVRRSEMELLNNTYYRLKATNKLNVAYLGGSVTAGFGATSGTKSWRALTTAWLKKQYPNAQITETNAGIGGTGSIYGAHRVIQDLKLESATEKPDLVFIEFAYNDEDDKYVNTTPDAYMESIVQTIYKYAPQADIVMVYITGFNQKDKEFAAKVAHKKIADAYQIPYIDVGARLWKEIVQEKGGSAPTSKDDATWKKYFSDSVHPANAGYAKYAQYVQEFLSDVFSKKTATPSGLTKAYLPANTVTKLPVAPHVANFKGLTAPSGLAVSSEGYITSTTDGASFTFKFTGTDLMFWIYACNGQFKIQVDGGTAKQIGFSTSNHRIIPIATGLSNGEHTVKVTLAPGVSTGTLKLDLRYFLISGDTQMRGITLV